MLVLIRRVSVVTRRGHSRKFSSVPVDDQKKKSLGQFNRLWSLTVSVLVDFCCDLWLPWLQQVWFQCYDRLSLTAGVSFYTCDH